MEGCYLQTLDGIMVVAACEAAEYSQWEGFGHWDLSRAGPRVGENALQWAQPEGSMCAAGLVRDVLARRSVF
jgi:hypothetical protein